ncbi:MAG: mechanosensitive ion channel [Clostridia bacterium]|nr:mechanosensitive ion channel [Clostridia bacterium]
MSDKLRFFFLTVEEQAPIIDDITTSNPLLDENGQFNDVPTAFNNIIEYLDSLQLVEKFMEKLPTIIIAVLLVVIGYFLSRLARKLVVKAMKARKVDPSVYNFIKRIVSVAINFVFIMSAASMFINVSSLLAAVGAAGVTAGLGLQSTVAQFASGIQILMNHPFKTGDFVELNGVSGSVADIRFMNTVITTPDNKRIVIPNSHITTNHIINYSAENKRRVDFTFSISYSDNIEKAKAVIKEVALSNENVLKDPLPEVYVGSHEASSINLTARVWCKVDKYWDVYFAMQEAVKIALDKNGICIPFNQLDVHIINK